MTDPLSDPDEFTTERTADPTDDLAGIALPHSSATWKVLGELGAPGGIGVLGHNTATTGVAMGVRGGTDSATADAAGVRGVATGGSGRTYGIEGVTRSSRIFAAGVRARAPNGARGVFASARDEGVYAQASAAQSGAAGVLGESVASSGRTYGVRGITQSNDAEAAGVRGTAEGGSGRIYGVFGTSASAAGYGLGTPDDARIEGAIDTAGTDFRVLAGPAATSNATNVVHGHASNQATSGVVAAAIGGGGYDDGASAYPNVVFDDFGTVGGGRNNQVGTDDGDPTTARFATIGGGGGNTASDEFATVGGGAFNTASAHQATVAGGNNNFASGSNAMVGGGQSSVASASHAMVPGGHANTADGEVSFAAGRSADTNGNNGAFVWGDSSFDSVTAGATDQFVVQAGGGATIYTSSDLSTGAELPAGSGSWSSLSARSAKENVRPVSARSVLERVERLDIATWGYAAERGEVRHMGPMAGEFHDAFGLGGNERRISTVDADGVALAAIQGLSSRLDEAREELTEKNDRIAELEREGEHKAERIEELEERLAALEAQVDADTAQAGD